MPSLVSCAFTVTAEYASLQPDAAEDLAMPTAHCDHQQEPVVHSASEQPSQRSSQQPSEQPREQPSQQSSQQATHGHQQDVGPAQSPAGIGPSLAPSDLAPSAYPAVAAAANGTADGNSAPAVPQGRKRKLLESVGLSASLRLCLFACSFLAS